MVGFGLTSSNVCWESLETLLQSPLLGESLKVYVFVYWSVSHNKALAFLYNRLHTLS